MTLSDTRTHTLSLLLMSGFALATPGLASAQVAPEQDIVAPSVDNPAGPAVDEGLDDTADDRISGTVGVSYNSHFISYGADVWGGGDDFFGSESTGFVFGEFSLDVKGVTVTAGVWGDINDNVESEIGGEIQEIDVYAGLSYTIANFTLGATYQEWYYAGDEERIVDISVAYDDTGLIFDNFALNPSFLAHLRVDGNGGQEESEAFVLGISPSYTLFESTVVPTTLAIPVNVAFFTDEFQGGDSGFGYVSVGADLSADLGFIPAEYGSWTGNVGITYFHTEDDAIPGNPEDDFITGTVGLTLAF